MNVECQLCYLPTGVSLNSYCYEETKITLMSYLIAREGGGLVVKALRYKPAGRGFYSRWCH